MYMNGLRDTYKMKNERLLMLLALLLTVAMLLPNTKVNASEKKDYGKMLEIVKEELQNDDLDSEEDVRKALDEASKKYDVELSDQETEKIIDVMNTVNRLDIDKETLVSIVDDVYDKVEGKLDGTTSEAMDIIEKQIIESATEAVKDNVKKTVSDYFSDFWNTISGFINKYFG